MSLLLLRLVPACLALPLGSAAAVEHSSDSSAVLPRGSALVQLEDFRWQHRLLLIFTPSLEDPRCATQSDLLRPFAEDFRERHLVVLTFAGDDVRGEDARRSLGVGREQFRVILVGKDGGAKLVASEPVDPKLVLGEIDRMPMRRAEMREKDRHGPKAVTTSPGG